jgi:predicted DNA binding CopG/RHH family protein
MKIYYWGVDNTGIMRHSDTMRKKAAKSLRKTKRLAVQLPESLITRGKVRAAKEGRSLTKMLAELLGNYLDRVGEP